MFEIADGNEKVLRTTDDYGQAIFWARHYVTNCGASAATVYLGNSFTVGYYTSY